MSDREFRGPTSDEIETFCDLFEIEMQGHKLLDSGSERNAVRHATSLGLMIVAALARSGGVSPRDVFEMCVRPYGWESEDIEEFLDGDTQQWDPEDLEEFRFFGAR